MSEADDVRAQIAALQQRLRELERPPPLPVYIIGDQLRVISDHRPGQKAPIEIGTVGTVVCVTPKHEAVSVYFNCAAHVYLLAFDEEDLFGRELNTWGYADGDVQAADAPYRKLKAERRKPK